MNARILLVEDEPGLSMIVSDLLRSSGYSVDAASDGPSGFAKASEDAYDLLILDIMLPGMDGFAICHNLRERGFDGAILMLTARGQVDDRIHGLRTGADDYLVKPFDSNELLARVAALLRRVYREQFTPVQRFQFGELEIDFKKPEVRRNGAKLNLAAKELQLLRCLIDNRGQVLSREQLLSKVWKEQPYITPRTVDTHVAWLRQKIEPDPQLPRHIITVRGEGYRFDR